MSNREVINDEFLDNISGGAVTYTWDKEAKQGSLGINGNNPYILLDKDAFLAVYNELFGKVSDAAIVRTLREKGIIRLP